MRTIKALVCVAALAAGVVSTMAQSNVYSLNVVGYYNITCLAHQKIIVANQLNTTNNSINALFVEPMIGNGDALFKWNGAGFDPYTYSTDDGFWTPPPGHDANVDTVAPGEAAFYLPSAARTLTFVGEVEQGTLTVGLKVQHKVLVSSRVPQAGQVGVDLYLAYANGDALFTYNPNEDGGAYFPYTYASDDGYWNYAFPPYNGPGPVGEPVVNVGQGFFYINALSAADAVWTRNFTVQ